jgi:hypothetical protein
MPWGWHAPYYILYVRSHVTGSACTILGTTLIISRRPGITINHIQHACPMRTRHINKLSLGHSMVYNQHALIQWGHATSSRFEMINTTFVYFRNEAPPSSCLGMQTRTLVCNLPAFATATSLSSCMLFVTYTIVYTERITGCCHWFFANCHYRIDFRCPIYSTDRGG